MIKIGMLLADRYEVIEKIGTGGMSDVYKAKDHKLNRFVAMKVLKQEFSENTNFVSKFRVEAQAAAGLMHPNIVNVYDVGEEKGMHYIVMELVEGITLKKYIEKKVHLTTKEAISIAIQVAMGIEAAHNNHIIHRDIKPQNIIISKEGKVKVTDFGIAKAATSNTITSNVMGSVHYTSPEQARGGFSDEKSDVYSMGITLFEMLTGRVPFNGDTTVTIAIKHIQEDMPSPRDIVADVPISVEQIVFKCTQKSPDRRYQNMESLISDLKRSLVSPDEDFVHIQDTEEISKTKIVTDVDVRLSRKSRTTAPKEEYLTEENDDIPVKKNRASYEGNRANPRTNRQNMNDTKSMEQDEEASFDINSRIDDRLRGRDYYDYSEEQDALGQTRDVSTSKKSVDDKKKKKNSAKGKTQSKAKQINYQDKYDFEDEYDYNPKMEHLTTALTIIAALAIAAILLYFAGRAAGVFESIGGNNGSSSQESVERAVMPAIIGKDLETAKEELKKVGLGCKVAGYEESTKYAQNQVITTTQEDGTKILEGDKILLNTTIYLTVSAGADGVPVPDVLGLSEAEATAMLKKEGFVVNKTDAYSEEYAKGTVMEQLPAKDSIAPLESEITIVISKGNSNVAVRVPEVLHMTEEAAKSTLEAAGLVVNSVEEAYSSEYAAGEICYQSYQTGTMVDEGALIDLKVSVGQEVTTYNCNINVQAPGDYQGGTAEVVLTGADGTQLWYSQNVESFPVTINLTGFSSNSPYGVVTISYLKAVEEQVVDSDGNTTTQTNQALTQSQQTVQFTPN